jgi:hypothetical protein
MSRLGFNADERALVAQMVLSRESRRQRLWFYSAALVPAVVFGGYGIVRADMVALIVGFGALAFFTYWNLASEFKNSPIFFSIFAKIDAFERHVDT